MRACRCAATAELRANALRQLARVLQRLRDMDTFKIDMKRIREEARAHMAKGAVTEDYSADRKAVLDVLNTVLATELVCTLRYRNNALVADGMQAEVVAAEFREHADEEQQHADQVAERIARLGGEPDMNPATLLERSHAPYTTSTNLRELVTENLVAERVAVSTYREIVRWLGDHDPTSRRLMEELLAKEEEHADELAGLLERPDR